MENTKKEVISNLLWRFAERCGAQLVAFIVSIVLARILTPNEYGIIALITVFTTILEVFVDSGLGNALIQKKDADDIDFSTVFYTNIIFCTILYLILYIVSPVIAEFYNNKSLTKLIRVLGITIIISGTKNVQQAYVSKKMIFKKFFFATSIGTIIAAILGITMAINGFGVWALVAQQLTNLTIDTVILWLTVRWRPKIVFSFYRLKVLFSYGWKLLVSSLLETVYNNARQLIIGKYYSSEDLAYYNKGKHFPNFFISNINTAINSVLLPSMSEEQDNKSRLKKMTRQSIRVSAFIIAPLMMGLAACSNNIVKLLLTDKWMPICPYIIIFAFSYMLYPIHTANLNAIKAMGRSDIFLKLEIIKKIIGIILLIIAARFGVLAMAYSLLMSDMISQLINAWPNKKLLDYGYAQQLKDIVPSITLAIVMGIIVYIVGNFLNFNILIKLLIQVLIGMIIYICGTLIFKIDIYKFIFNTLKK